MKRFRRWLSNTIAAISLILFFAFMVWWPISFRCGDNMLSWGDPSNWVYLVDCQRGEITFAKRSRPGQGPIAWSNFEHVDPPRLSWYDAAWTDSIRNRNTHAPGDFAWAFLQIAFDSAIEPGYRVTFLSVPIWLLALLTLTPSLFWANAHRRSRQPGFCTACGYDLRATLDRCPECGKIVERVI